MTWKKNRFREVMEPGEVLVALDGISAFKLELRHAVQFLIIFLGRMWNKLFSMRLLSLYTHTSACAHAQWNEKC